MAYSLIGIAAAYLIGGMPLGLLLCIAVKGVDPRQHGSGNIGATNISRILGPAGGIAVFAMDAAKGFCAVRIAEAIGGHPTGWYPVFVAVSALAGNNWPVWLWFKGGKGSSVSLGIGLAVLPVVAVLAFAVWIALLVTTHYVSVASIGAVSSAPLLALAIVPDRDRAPALAFTVGVAALVIYKHRANIRRLRAGEEPRFSLKRD